MKKLLIVVGFILFFFWRSVAAQSLPEGNFTGGFWLEGNWVAVNFRVRREKESLSGDADVVFPSNSRNVSVRNANLNIVKSDSADLIFEIPLNNEKIIYRGQMQSDTIKGKFEYRMAQGDFGLTRVAYPAPEILEKYYGIYRVSADRFISVYRAGSDPRTLLYTDYKTGLIGTLWASVRDHEFFSGAGREISFPVALKVSFDKDTNGKIKSLSWQGADEPKITAQRIELKEERITFKNGDVTLGGTLILPARKGRHPVVIVTPGDYGSSREMLRMFAHNFVSRGVAALIFDSRGAGESTGTAYSTSFSDLANDVLAGVDSLKNRADINPRKIGLFGFSNSAFTVSLAASRSKDVAFLILQSFVGVLPWKQEIFRAERQLRVDNYPESIVKQGADFMRLKWEVARTGKGWDELQAIMEKSRGERWLAYTNMSRSLERLSQVYETSMTYDPVPALENLKIPVLAYWGGNDSYLPVEETTGVFKRAMAKAKNKDYTIKVFPKGRHDLVEGESGSPGISARLKNFPAGFWKMQTDWLLQRVKVSK
jgi:dienelactone hydrolase